MTEGHPKPDLDNINAYSKPLVKRPCYLLQLSSGNENMGVSRADNSVKNLTKFAR